MSLELVNTVASLITVTIVAATAITALVQLRHLRSANQVSALMSVGEKLDTRQFTEALTLVHGSLQTELADSAYRAYEIAIYRSAPPPAVHERHIAMHNAVLLVGNTFELMGILVKKRVVDPMIFLDEYCEVTLRAWTVLQSYTALGREAMDWSAAWENFEYLAVLSEDFMQRHPSTYPKGVRRLEVRNPWPILKP